jgi:hypothetical protein
MTKWESITRSDHFGLRVLPVVVLALSLTACATVKPPPPPVVTGSALALPAVGKVVPLYVFLRTEEGLNISVARTDISGVTPQGEQVQTLDVEEASEAAGGPDQLVATLSDESEIGHVAKMSGATLKVCTLAGLSGGCAGDPILCAAGGALGAAVGIVGAIGVGTYYGVNKHARQVSMLEMVALPNGVPRNSLQGYIFLPTNTYQTLRLVVKDPRTSLSQQVEIKVQSGKLSAPGHAPEPRTCEQSTAKASPASGSATSQSDQHGQTDITEAP